ncbi:MAG: hypothetical protein LBU32_06785 [Clostridiales bacterium]|nr:hypothetical protein [Clostridiales bacterium]
MSNEATDDGKADSRRRSSGDKRHIAFPAAEIINMASFLFGVYMIPAIWSRSETAVGTLGGFLGDLIFGMFGVGALIVPLVVIALSVKGLFFKDNFIGFGRYFLAALIFLFFISLVHLMQRADYIETSMDAEEYAIEYFTQGSYENGGYMGGVIGDFVAGFLGRAWAMVLLATLLAALAIKLMGKSIGGTITYGVEALMRLMDSMREMFSRVDENGEEKDEYEERVQKPDQDEISKVKRVRVKKIRQVSAPPKPLYIEASKKPQKPTVKAIPKSKPQEAAQIQVAPRVRTKSAPPPPVSSVGKRSAPAAESENSIQLIFEEMPKKRRPQLQSEIITLEEPPQEEDEITIRGLVDEEDETPHAIDLLGTNSLRSAAKKQPLQPNALPSARRLQPPTGPPENSFEYAPDNIKGYRNESQKPSSGSVFREKASSADGLGEPVLAGGGIEFYDSDFSYDDGNWLYDKEGDGSEDEAAAALEFDNEPAAAEKSGGVYVPPGGRQSEVFLGDQEPAAIRSMSIPANSNEESMYKSFKLPPIELLNKNAYASSSESRARIRENSKKLEDTLRNFKVEAKVVGVSIGPTVTRYELAPGQGVKVSSIANLSNDLALSLAAQGIRIEAPIPGKSAVGVEIPNKDMQSVYLREILEDEIFKKFPSKLAFAVGKDIAGNTVVADVEKMPHLLIAGATGSGKSVCINTLIASILYKAKPNEIKLLMIDPKVVELSVYNGIPHLLAPVVTDPKKAAATLGWAVTEMDIRYNLFAEANVRELKSYNHQKAAKGEKDILPQIVIIIDELADLMMMAKGEIEELICRLAQKARAAGLHLIIATQRPSVDVITGLIKANIPSRLAFAVSSGTDSRTVLDMTGAEKLLGKGDMLFLPVGLNKPIRVQCGFISDQEVEKIVEFLKSQQEATYDKEMVEKITDSSRLADSDKDMDEFYKEAVEFLMTKGKASASMLQRQFRIGYNRASRLIEDLEAHGIVGPEDGSKPRKLLITMEQWRRGGG